MSPWEGLWLALGQHTTVGPARCGAVGLSTEPGCCCICRATEVSLFLSIKKWLQSCAASYIRQILRNETAVYCVNGGGVCETGELPCWRYGITETIACKQAGLEIFSFPWM